MVRKLLYACLAVGLATLGLAGCAYRSDVDLAPMADRPARPIIPPGDYCEATASSPPYRVKSAEGCERIGWDSATRTHLIRLDDERDAPTAFAPFPLGDDLYLLQADAGEASPDGRYHVMLVLAKGAAIFMMPPLGQDEFIALAARHPGVTLRQAEGKEPVIASGDPAALRLFLAEAAREALRATDLEEDDLNVAIRDRAGAPDHEANGMQTMNIIDIVTALFGLQAAE